MGSMNGDKGLNCFKTEKEYANIKAADKRFSSWTEDDCPSGNLKDIFFL